MGLFVAALCSPAAATTAPMPGTVTFAGSAADPQITIDGSGFGTEPAPTNAGYPGYTGYDYGNALYFCDTSNNPQSFCAGQNDGKGNGSDTIGLVIASYSDTHIGYTLGSDYGSYYYPSNIFRAEPGDQFTVHVNGATCSGTIAYSGQPVSCTVAPPSPTPTPTPSPMPTPTPNPTPLPPPPSPTLPPPVLGKTVNIAPVNGQVFIKPASATKGQPFIPLTEPRQISIGTEVDTTRGFAGLYTTGDNRKLQSGSFGSTLFQILQKRQERGLTELRLMNGPERAKACRRTGTARAARKRPSQHVLGLLRANAHGRFRTVGGYSAATVRGTDWDVIDRCDGTLTFVLRGTVIVRDFRLRRNITVHAGKSYLAKAP
jgi:hypothetical protein